ncbi:MAG: HisA/HisF-related TIM barrel protein [Thermoproteota archaeon]
MRMLIIPVIDIKGGLAVKAKMGMRELYQPLSDSIYGTCDPVELALKLRREGFRVIYIADLDSISGGEINEAVFKKIKELGLRIIADVGINCWSKLERSINVADLSIIATESMPNLKFFSNALEEYGERIALGLDVKNGKIISRSAELADRDVLDACGALKGLNVKRVVLIDLWKVGTSSGPCLREAGKLVEEGFEVYVGGGIRDLEDVFSLHMAGVSGVLIASALHTGKIKADDIKGLGPHHFY